jgi:hypothetical protein
MKATMMTHYKTHIEYRIELFQTAYHGSTTATATRGGGTLTTAIPARTSFVETAPAALRLLLLP